MSGAWTRWCSMPRSARSTRIGTRPAGTRASSGSSMVNVLGPIHAARAFLPGMIERRRGRIVMVGSLAGRMGGLIAGPHYVASKGGLHALVKWLARQAGPHGVLVNGIAPASVETPMMAGQPVDSSRIPLGRHGPAGGDRLADRLSLLARGKLHLWRRARRERRRLYGLIVRRSPEEPAGGSMPDFSIVGSHVYRGCAKIRPAARLSRGSVQRVPPEDVLGLAPARATIPALVTAAVALHLEAEGDLCHRERMHGERRGRIRWAMYLRNGMMHQQQARAERIPLKGNFVWSAMDKFEWTDGYGTGSGSCTSTSKCRSAPRG